MDSDRYTFITARVQFFVCEVIFIADCSSVIEILVMDFNACLLKIQCILYFSTG